MQDTSEDAPHELQVVAFSARGEDPTPAVFRWSVDSTPLTVNGFSADTPSHKREAKFSFSYQRSAQSSEASDMPSGFECKLDDEEYEPCGRPAGATSWSKTYPGLSKGDHVLSVRVFDQVGNASDPVTHQWTVGDAYSFLAAPDTRWPDVVGTEVRSVISDRCGGWYVGGTFTGVGNDVGFSNLAHITASKTVDATWVPIVSGGIRTMLLSSDRRTLYVGGEFTSVNGIGRSHLAAVTTPLATGCGLAAGNAVTGWDPDPNNYVHALAFPTARNGGESYVYAAGAFSSFNGATVTRRKLAELRTTDSGTVVESWDPDVNNTATLYALATFNDSLYVGGTGMTTIGGAARNNLAELVASTAQATSWEPNPNGAVYSIKHRRKAVFDDVVPGNQLPTLFVGGSFTQIGNPPKEPARGGRDRGIRRRGRDALEPGRYRRRDDDFLPITTYNTVLGGSFGVTTQGGRFEQLGVDAIWISPFCKTPMKDYGYDVADYCAVDPLFGTLADFDAMLAEAHRLGLKVMMDFVPSTPATSTPGSRRAARAATTPRPTGTSGPTPGPTAPAQQLAGRVRRQRLGVGAAPRPVLPAQLPQGAARPQLPQPAGDRGAARPRPASGSSAASTASASTRSTSASTTRSCATTRRAALRSAGGSAPGSPFAMQGQLWNKARPELIELFLKPLHALTERYPGKVLLGEISGDDALLRAAEYTNGGGLDIAYSFDLLTAPARPGASAARSSIWRGRSATAGAAGRSATTTSAAWSPAGAATIRPRACAGWCRCCWAPCAARSASTRARSWGWRRPRSPSSSSGTRSASPSGPPSPAATAAARRCPGSAPARGRLHRAASPGCRSRRATAAARSTLQDPDPASALNTTRAFLNWRRERAAAAGPARSVPARARGSVLAFERADEADRILCLFNLGGEPQLYRAPASRCSTPASPARAPPSRAATVELPPWGYAFAHLD